jgi:hypothetical protein
MYNIKMIRVRGKEYPGWKLYWAGPHAVPRIAMPEAPIFPMISF